MDHPQVLSPDLAAWLESFHVQHGRSPRLLHIGNIANNAYLNAKLLNRAGLDCDVLCYDYYHIMACPEWEDADYLGNIQSDFYPTWTQVDLRGFERPGWFAQGPLLACMDYLMARRAGRADAKTLWDSLCEQREHACANLRGKVRAPTRVEKLKKLAGKLARKFWKLPYILAQRNRKLHWAILNAMTFGQSKFIRAVRRVCNEFQTVFPDRSDRLMPTDLVQMVHIFPRWSALLHQYDMVVGYATDGQYPMIVGDVPYVAFEHGTIRNIPFEPTLQGRLCALTYRLSNQAFITNCDNRLAAEKLRLPRCRFVPHPINEDVHPTADPSGIRKLIREQLDADFIVFHPSRQHWSAQRNTDWDNGNDILIEGFARFVREVNPKAGAVFVVWGQTVAQSRELIDKLGITNRVMWIPAQPTPRMNAYVRASDALADQFVIGAFGSTMPRGLMVGTPNLIYLDEELHRWCMPEMPPIVNVRTPEEVFAALTRLYKEQGYARQVVDAGVAWYGKYHSIRVVADAFVSAVREAVSNSSQEARPHAS